MLVAEAALGVFEAHGVAGSEDLFRPLEDDVGHPICMRDVSLRVNHILEVYQ